MKSLRMANTSLRDLTRIAGALALTLAGRGCLAPTDGETLDLNESASFVSGECTVDAGQWGTLRGGVRIEGGSVRVVFLGIEGTTRNSTVTHVTTNEWNGKDIAGPEVIRSYEWTTIHPATPGARHTIAFAFELPGSNARPSCTVTVTAPGAKVCDDYGTEPNQDESSAAEASGFGPVHDCSETEHALMAVLDGPGDVDWYAYDIEDEFGCYLAPWQGVVPESADKPVRLCAFAECKHGGITKVGCPAGTTVSVSPGGRNGCCGFERSASGAHGDDIGVYCEGIDESARIYLRVDNPDGGACSPYTLMWN